MADGQHIEDGKRTVRVAWYVRRAVTTSALYGPGLGVFAGAGAMVLRNAGAGIGGGAFGYVDPVRVGAWVGLATVAFCVVFYANALRGALNPGARYVDALRADLPDPLLFVRPALAGPAPGAAVAAPGRAARPRADSVLERRAAGRPDPAEAVTRA